MFDKMYGHRLLLNQYMSLVVLMMVLLIRILLKCQIL